MKPDEVKRSYEFGPFRLDPEDRTLSRDGELVPLTIKAFDTLLVLVENAGHLLAKGRADAARLARDRGRRK